MIIVAEGDIRSAFDFEGYSSRLAFVALGTMFFFLDAESLYPGVTGSAGLGLFHVCHGVAGFFAEIVDGIVTDPAVVSVFQ